MNTKPRWGLLILWRLWCWCDLLLVIVGLSSTYIWIKIFILHITSWTSVGWITDIHEPSFHLFVYYDSPKPKYSNFLKHKSPNYFMHLSNLHSLTFENFPELLDSWFCDHYYFLHSQYFSGMIPSFLFSNMILI